MPSHLTKLDRKALDYYLRCGRTQKQIADTLGRDPSVISREITRNKDADGVYHYGAAHRKYLERRKNAKQPQKKIVHTPALAQYIETGILTGWSPEQIAGRLRLTYGRTIICHETIYQWVYNDRPDLRVHLPFKDNPYRRKYGTRQRGKRRREAQFRSIAERPKAVEQRSRLGDYEGDTVVGKTRKQRILTHTERKSGYGFGALFRRVTAPLIEKETIALFSSLPKNKRHTITYDRGGEFGGEDDILEKETQMQVYRANPYHSWERGCVENFNGLLRRFFPKGTDFRMLTQENVDRAIALLNNRPRKRLNYLTPHEVFIEEYDPVAFQTRI